MDKIGSLSDPELIEAVKVWTGWGTEVSPSNMDARLELRYGQAEAAQLLPALRALQGEFYYAVAEIQKYDILEQVRAGSQAFKLKHPDASDEIIKAFAWCYSFDFR